MSDSFNERRKHIRIYRNFILSYHVKGRATFKHYVSQVNNVSKGGVNFTSTMPLDPGVGVIVDLKTPFLADSIRLEGLVLECKVKVPELIYHVRLQFLGSIPVQAMAVLEKIEKYGKTK